MREALFLGGDLGIIVALGAVILILLANGLAATERHEAQMMALAALGTEMQRRFEISDRADPE